MKEIPIKITIVTRDIDAAARKAKAQMTDLERSIHTGFTRAQTQVAKFQMFVMKSVAAAGALAAAFQAVKASFESAVRLDRLERAYSAIYGGSIRANQQLEFLYNTSRRLGLQFQDAAENAKGFFAAGQGTTLAPELNRIFSAVSGAGATLALSQEQMSGVFLALGQMISKGKVQAEELRGQLGERLPGAFRLAAEAMGVTTAELDKMLEQGKVVAEDLLPKMADLLERKYPGAASEAVKATANLSTEWERFKAAASQTDTVVAAIERITDALREAANGMADMKAAQKLYEAGVAPENASGFWDRVAAATADGGADIDASDGGYSRAQLDAMTKYGATNPEQARQLMENAKALEANENAAIALDSALGKARSSYDTFVKETKNAKLSKLTSEYETSKKSVEAYIAKLNEAGDTKGAQEWTARLSTMRTEHERQVGELNKASSAANKADSARASILERLATITDTGTGAQSRIAKLSKDYDEFAKSLGAADPAVRRFADALAYAKEHGGYTPQEVAEATRELDKQIATLQARASAIEASTNADGTLDDTKLSYLEKMSAAQLEYVENVEKVGEAKARELLVLQEQDAAREKRKDDLAVQESFYNALAGMYKDDEKLRKEIIERQVETYRKAGVAEVDIARWRYKQELEAATDAASGVERALMSYSEGARNTAEMMESATTNALNTMETELDGFVQRGKLNFSSLVDSVSADLRRMAIKGAITGPLSEAMQGAFSGGGMFGGLFGGGSSASKLSGGRLSAGATAGELSTAFASSAPTTSFFGGMWNSISSLFGFAEGGSFTVGPQTALATIGSGGIDNRLIAFRARDGEDVTVTKPGQGRGGASVHMTVIAPDADSFRRSEGQIMARMGAATARANRRNG